MNLNRASKERIIENFLKDYNSYKVGIVNCKKQLEYITPTLIPIYSSIDVGAYRIENNTANIALERAEGKQAKALQKEIERFSLIVESIDRAVMCLEDKPKKFVHLRYFQGLPMEKVMEALEYAEEKSAYRVRRKVLDKFLISLNNLIGLK